MPDATLETKRKKERKEEKESLTTQELIKYLIR
jgi:hypothetical protein